MVDKALQQHPDHFIVLADHLQDLRVSPSDVNDIAGMLQVPRECLATTGTSSQYSVMHAVATHSPGEAPGATLA